MSNGAYGNDEVRKKVWDALWSALKIEMPADCTLPHQDIVLYFVGETKPEQLEEAIREANSYDEKECKRKTYAALRSFIDIARGEIQALKVGDYYDPKRLRS